MAQLAASRPVALLGSRKRGSLLKNNSKTRSSFCKARRAHSAKGALKVNAQADPDADTAPAEPEGQPNAAWRVIASLPYLVPLMGCLPFGEDLCDCYPLYEGIMEAFEPLLEAYYSSWFTPFLVFFGMFLLIVRNKNLPHFVRFNTMQSILLDICTMLGGLIIQYLPFEIAYSVWGTFLNDFTFLTGTFTVFYCMVNILRGFYPDIPVVSEAVYIQTP